MVGRRVRERRGASVASTMTRLCFNTFNRSAYLGVDPDLPGQIDAAADAGFRLFGPDVFSLDAWQASGRRVEELAEHLAERDMRCWGSPRSMSASASARSTTRAASPRTRRCCTRRGSSPTSVRRSTPR
jgi:hypothetical protein